ncbi:MAG: HDOD domain-containing protein [Desulfobulbaceae bacterium]|nr:HDOD domain-containing protein [Desulfobulbaceae bacterium]
MNSIWNQVTSAGRLISLPEVYLRLKEILDDPDYTLAEVARVVSKDPAVTVRLLRIVNSSLYSFSTEIETVGRAITLLGTQQVHDLVLATSVARSFSEMNLEVMDVHRFWRRSLYCAVTCKILGSASAELERRERLFVAGLLHDIGHLIMYQAIPEYSLEAMQLAKNDSIPIHLAERKLFAFDYAGVGGFMLSQWRLPEVLCEATKFHVEPNDTSPYAYETAIVHIASLLSLAFDDGGGDFEEDIRKIDPVIWKSAHLTAEQCLHFKEETDKEFQEALHVIFG